MVSVINAAGKLTALGGSAQSESVANAMAAAAGQHVDLAELRRLAGREIAAITGAGAACITTGAAAGITIGVAATLTGENLLKVQMLPSAAADNRILLQAGHAVNFGATVEQMIRLGGGEPVILGTTNGVPERLLEEALALGSHAAFVYIQSHHCVQENMIPLPRCIELCRRHKVPVIVDAAAEQDLTGYVEAGADLVTYSGGKAFGGPTSGFICGTKALIAACEMQFRGIARTMKVGKEQIMGLLKALDEYTRMDSQSRVTRLDEVNRIILDGLSKIDRFEAFLRPDEAGRDFSRVAVAAARDCFPIRDLVRFLAQGNPSIRTRNHHIDQGICQVDPRELTREKARIIVDRMRAFAEDLP